MSKRDWYLIGGGALAALAAVWWIGRDAAPDNTGVSRPSTDNFVYRAVNYVGDIFNDAKDDDDFRLGVALGDWWTDGDR